MLEELNMFMRWLNKYFPMWLRLLFLVSSNPIHLQWGSIHLVFFCFPLQKTVRDKEYKAFQIKLERLEKLCRALQTERNELNEKVEVLKEQVSGKVAGAKLAPHVTQPCAALASKELNTAWNSGARVPMVAVPKAAKEKPATHKAASLGTGPTIESVDWDEVRSLYWELYFVYNFLC